MKGGVRRAGILVIGNEVLDGIILDTNSNWMELRLASLGVQVTRLATVRDNLDEIKHGLLFLRQASDVIFTSGGLGPTHDDMTLEAVAQTFGRRIVEDPRAAAIVKRQYKMLFEKGIVDSPDYIESRRKMALIPEGSVPLDNRVGGAPGVRLDLDDVVVFCLPGVPAELKFIFDDSVVPWLEERIEGHYYEKIVEFPVKDESIFAPLINKAMRKNPGVYIKSMPKRYGTTDVLRVWVSARGEDEQRVREIVESAIEELSRLSGTTPAPVSQ
ncbi:MAG: competence/damage-inducible protein A [Candidatus Thorarchaeota archaeon]